MLVGWGVGIAAWQMKSVDIPFLGESEGLAAEDVLVCNEVLYRSGVTVSVDGDLREGWPSASGLRASVDGGRTKPGVQRFPGLDGPEPAFFAARPDGNPDDHTFAVELDVVDDRGRSLWAGGIDAPARLDEPNGDGCGYRYSAGLALDPLAKRARLGPDYRSKAPGVSASTVGARGEARQKVLDAGYGVWRANGLGAATFDTFEAYRVPLREGGSAFIYLVDSPEQARDRATFIRRVGEQRTNPYMGSPATPVGRLVVVPARCCGQGATEPDPAEFTQLIDALRG